MPADASQLEGFEALRDFDASDLASLARNLQSDRFRAGSQLCREGDEGDGCFFLVEGDIEVTKNLPDGRRVHLATLQPGTFFGQAGLVPGQRRTADVKAATNVVVLTLKMRTLEWGLNNREGWSVALQAIVAVSLVRQLRSALERLAALAADENSGEAAQGRTRASIPQPRGIEMKRKQRRKTDPGIDVRAQEEWDALPEIPDDDTAMSQRGLLSLLAETESSLAGMGYDLENVDFVFDEDQKRTADARKA